uniref:Uncharacterized protein n=1 Tax=Rhabditophanes sp. KR3021 TaxID=114890 RepID=A0AC35TUU9_9BILA
MISVGAVLFCAILGIAYCDYYNDMPYDGRVDPRIPIDRLYGADRKWCPHKYMGEMCEEDTFFWYYECVGEFNSRCESALRLWVWIALISIFGAGVCLGCFVTGCTVCFKKLFKRDVPEVNAPPRSGYNMGVRSQRPNAV